MQRRCVFHVKLRSRSPVHDGIKNNPHGGWWGDEMFWKPQFHIPLSILNVTAQHDTDTGKSACSNSLSISGWSSISQGIAESGQ